MAEGQAAPGNRGRHTLTLAGRERLDLDGVQRVENFDDHTVVLETVMGRLTIRGEGLHIHELNLEEGRLRMTGRVSLLAYEDSAQRRRDRRNLLERLLK
ncbi:sporulation protein YabP [Thermaerobacter marianensis DSM 12885]|uniref:Sporulation protein YabP n=1 Tax=Thermaerobacter marianensis (strain ATCC 700841 / DSM 12885 / JCM 10246 / 7p75a) TaxID=644966 RepID=E6SL27_THEM7|nr:sporulation protein YabP [Thermaerobacter marianensis]ADU50229.1 sporulation protein YabP [Thermaerobacter marianensis DSM 12885]